uniref:TLC domain-containing protein n=1 Tax=Strombidium inclinatum TaxID=197538 RepID=A0A7S3IL81_9SPIT
MNIRHALLNGLNATHALLLKTTGFDMDKFQAWVYGAVPDFNSSTFLWAVGLSFIFWIAAYFFIYLVVVEGIMNGLKGTFEFPRYYLKKTTKERMFYVTYWVANFHAFLSAIGALYCFFYADGEKDTTWFHCNYYKLTMFPIQKYLNCFSIGYFLQDTFICTVVSGNSSLMIQTYFHHIVGGSGSVMAVVIGGFFGSMCQLSYITEISTFFLNVRALMAEHKLDNQPLYYANGLVLTGAFFVFRVFFYHYMIFWKIQDYAFYRYQSFWTLYPPEHYWMCCSCILLYTFMYFLQLFWFSKILFGLLKAFGVDKAIQATEKAEQKIKQD